MATDGELIDKYFLAVGDEVRFLPRVMMIGIMLKKVS